MADKIETTDVFFPLDEGIEALSAVLPFAVKASNTKETADILKTVRVANSAEGVEFTATDRYAVGKYMLQRERLVSHFAEGEAHADALPVLPSEDEMSVVLPYGAAEWILSTKRKTLRKGGSTMKLSSEQAGVRHFFDTFAPYAYTVRIRETRDERGSVSDVEVSLIHTATGKVERSQSFDGVSGNFPPTHRLFPSETVDVPEGTLINPSHLGKVAAYFAKWVDTEKQGGLRIASAPKEGEKPAPMVLTAGSLTVLVMTMKKPKWA